MKTVIIGLDLSINSTGIVVRDKNDNSIECYCIVDKILKKYEKLADKKITLIQYNKLKLKDFSLYNEKEHAKTQNIFNIVEQIKAIIQKYNSESCKVECVYIEGMAFSSTKTNSLIELGAINYLCRQFFINTKITYSIVSPTENKKNACGNGGANKETMIMTFKQFHPEIIYMEKYCKIDDIADAFFLCMTPLFA